MSIGSENSQQFLPLDSSIKVSSQNSSQILFTNTINPFNNQESSVCLLVCKIDQLQKNYIGLQRKYLKRIKQLKDDLSQKNKTQSLLSQQLQTLSKQYSQHKIEIQNILIQIKKSLDEQLPLETKLKSKSPKQRINPSPRRIIKKSLDLIRNDKLSFQKQITSIQSYKQLQNIQKQEKIVSTKQTNNHKLVKQQKLMENKIESSKQIIENNVRKNVNSPSNNVNGPSPKKKLIFNSSKQLDLFSNPIPKRLSNGSPGRKTINNLNQTIIQKQNENKQKVQNQITKLDQKPVVIKNLIIKKQLPKIIQQSIVSLQPLPKWKQTQKNAQKQKPKLLKHSPKRYLNNSPLAKKNNSPGQRNLRPTFGLSNQVKVKSNLNGLREKFDGRIFQ